MEIRVLRYFLEIAREGNMTRAAETLHVTQPTLSRQIKDLEQELRKKLFIRGSSSVSLTDEGMLLRKRAEDILNMVDKTASEFNSLDEILGGDIEIGCAESDLIKYLAKTIKEFKKTYPLLRYHITSGGTTQMIEQLDKGLLDFAFIVEPPNLDRYNYIEVPGTDEWGLIIPSNHVLALKKEIEFKDLLGLELICSKQGIKNDISRWCGEKLDQLNFSGTINLVYNGGICVKEGLGCLLSFNHLINTSEENGLCFRPLFPTLKTKMYIIWKKYQIFTPIAQRLLSMLKQDYGKKDKMI